MSKEIEEELLALNQEICDLENDSNEDNYKRLKEIVASALAFPRGSGKIVDRCGFLAANNPNNPSNPGDRRIKPESFSVNLYGNRAVVSCVVTMNGLDTHNIRLFVKEDGNWKLLGWANEPV
jgi:hypothetical protein